MKRAAASSARATWCSPSWPRTDACGAAEPSNQLMSQSLVVAIVFSTGKNGAIAPDATRTDEAANLDADAVFVYHAAQSSGAAGGEFDDQFTWITVGELMGRLVAA